MPGFQSTADQALREKNRKVVEIYMHTKGQDRLKRHELFVDEGCGFGPRIPVHRLSFAESRSSANTPSGR